MIDQKKGRNTLEAVWPAIGCVLCLATFAVSRAVAGVTAPPITPDQGNTYDLYAGGDEQYDSNLFRVSSAVGSVGSLVAPNATRADRISTVSAGGDGQWLLGRQVLHADLHADQNWFAHNTFLNNTSGNANFLWDWQVGGHFSGTAGATYSHALVSFGEALFLGRDLVDSTNYFGTGRFQVGPHWAVYGGVSDANVSHSAVPAQTGNFRTQGGNAGVEYALDVADTLSVEYHYDQGRFRTGQLETLGGVTFSPDFHDDTLLLILKHAFSDKTQLIADGGYVKRFYPNTSVGTYSGGVGRATLNWQPTDKTQVAFAGWRELHAYLVSQTNYFVETGGSIKPTWFATDKISVSMLFSYGTQKYIQTSTSVVTLGPVTTKGAVESLNVNYTPRDNWILGLAYIHTNRTSNAVSFQYGDDLATVSVLYKTR
ncbi:MAG: hypothetical protein JWN43_601 [Gammaproteobacteria bacterium]|nr:hypothetical protein [Gammaproteobacteria bacterium]